MVSTGTDAETICSTPGATPNTANCGAVAGDFTPVGSYTGSASPHGALDQGGIAVEWADRIVILENRVVRGGHFGSTPDWLTGLRSEYDDLGPLTCIENDSADASSQSTPQTETPPPGAVFFYLVRFQQGPLVGPWGFGSDGSRRAGSGGCHP